MVKNCCVCEKDDASYKCPTCRKSYCSVACCREHKTQPCEALKSPEKSEEHHNAAVYQFPTEDTVPLEKLQQLRHSEELKSCLKNPHVREMMKHVLQSKNPTNAIALAMREPLFVEMADVCLKVVELQGEPSVK